MNVRRSGKSISLSPVSGVSSSMDRGVLDAEAFRRMITLERKRSERSRKPFVLLLLDMGEHLPSDKNGKTLAKILAALSLTTRETDITGWYADQCVVGVMFTEIGNDNTSLIPGTIVGRITETLRSNLTAEQFDQISLSFHVFPEDWDQDAAEPPSNQTLYPDLSTRDDARKVFRVMKRTMDILGSAVALIFLSPIFLIIAAAIKATSEGPVFFRQRRVGQHGKAFVFLKFRSMYVNNDAAAHREYVRQLIAGKADHQVSGNGEKVYKLTKDPRITRVGGFLRKTSLDEIPQFLNVLLGEMSLVGPRPPVPYEVEAYDIWHRRRLLEAKPGITGLWQVSGRCRITFDDMVRLDLRYARTWSPWMDIKILVRTPGAVVLGEGAH
ncbi:MAG TPA: sugar transferase [Candidatus Dormibacteraeota bacterium]|nr:sugar transferase [Candidatus Dormibacteraeota bacterium]